MPRAALKQDGTAVRLIAECVIAAISYYLIARGSLLFASINPSATPIWPPTGFALAIVLLRGNWLLVAIAAGAFAANLAITPSILASACIAFGNTAEAFVGAALLRRWAGGPMAFLSPMGAVAFALVVGLAAAPISAMIGVSTLALFGFASWTNFASIWMTWWLGNFAGAVLAGPAFVLWLGAARPPAEWRLRRETIGMFALSAVIGLLAFSPVLILPLTGRGALAFLAVAPLLWAGLRAGPRNTATVALILSAFAVWGVAAGNSPFAHASQNESYLLLVAFIVAITLPSLVLSADSRRMRNALSRTREQLDHAQKLEALGQLTGGVAHDFNNLISAMSSGVAALEKRQSDPEKITLMLRQSIERGAALTRDLLTFARNPAGKVETLDLAKVIERMEGLLTHSLNPSIRLEICVAPEVCPVKVDRTKFELALLNLVINARHAMPAGGDVSIRVENDSERRHVRVVIADTGHGMTPELAARAFEPFVTTRAAEGGTGLGLAQVHSFVTQAGGSASIETAPGKGSKVILVLLT